MSNKQEKLFTKERLEQIYAHIEQRGRTTVSELSNEFEVTTATVRTDLQELEDMKLIIRTHGGAMSHPEKNIKEIYPSEKETLFLQEKQQIAQEAFNFVDDGDVLVLDTGTTIQELAKLIPQKKELTVITNDLKIALFLNSYHHIQTHLLGGIVRPDFHYTMESNLAEFLSTFTAHTAFVGCNAVDLEFGPSTSNSDLANLKKKMIEVSEKSILLCDSSKIGKKTFKSFSNVSNINYFITDTNISEAHLNQFSQAGVNMLKT